MCITTEIKKLSQMTCSANQEPLEISPANESIIMVFRRQYLKGVSIHDLAKTAIVMSCVKDFGIFLDDMCQHDNSFARNIFSIFEVCGDNLEMKKMLSSFVDIEDVQSYDEYKKYSSQIDWSHVSILIGQLYPIYDVNVLSKFIKMFNDFIDTTSFYKGVMECGYSISDISKYSEKILHVLEQ